MFDQYFQTMVASKEFSQSSPVGHPVCFWLDRPVFYLRFFKKKSAKGLRRAQWTQQEDISS